MKRTSQSLYVSKGCGILAHVSESLERRRTQHMSVRHQQQLPKVQKNIRTTRWSSMRYAIKITHQGPHAAGWAWVRGIIPMACLVQWSPLVSGLVYKLLGSSPSPFSLHHHTPVCFTKRVWWVSHVCLGPFSVLPKTDIPTLNVCLALSLFLKQISSHGMCWRPLALPNAKLLYKGVI
jgi:hypothetical protein